MEPNEFYGMMWAHMVTVEVIKSSNQEVVCLLTEQQCKSLGIPVTFQSRTPDYYGEN